MLRNRKITMTVREYEALCAATAEYEAAHDYRDMRTKEAAANIRALNRLGERFQKAQQTGSKRTKRAT